MIKNVNFQKRQKHLEHQIGRDGRFRLIRDANTLPDLINAMWSILETSSVSVTEISLNNGMNILFLEMLHEALIRHLIDDSVQMFVTKMLPF